MLKPDLKNNLKISIKYNNKHNAIFIILTFLYLFSSSNAFSESTFRVFYTQQPAQALIPFIAPLYSGQAKISAKNNALIIKAAPPILDEIAQLLQEIDKPLHNLLIEVSSSLEGDTSYQQDSVDGRIKIGSDTVISSRSPNTDNPSVSIRYGKNGSIVKSTHTRRNNSRNNPNTFKIRTLEGNWAFIQTGQKVPYYSSNYPNIRASNRRNYQQHTNTVELVDVMSGFEVLPTLNGEQVTLQVRPKNQSINRQYPDRINSRSVDTIVTGELGQWIFLGGAINTINEHNSGNLHSTKRYTEFDTNYRIKVNIVE